MKDVLWLEELFPRRRHHLGFLIALDLWGYFTRKQWLFIWRDWIDGKRIAITIRFNTWVRHRNIWVQSEGIYVLVKWFVRFLSRCPRYYSSWQVCILFCVFLIEAIKLDKFFLKSLLSWLTARRISLSNCWGDPQVFISIFSVRL